jgi:hypothetical protein
MILSQLIADGTDLRSLALQLEVPVVDGLQHQGDVSVVPAHMVSDYVQPRVSVSAAGVRLLRGESSGNTHRLLASGTVLFERAWRSVSDESMVTLGCLHVGDDAEAYLDHAEHGNSGIAPGAYVLRRKRAMADYMHYVAD